MFLLLYILATAQIFKVSQEAHPLVVQIRKFNLIKMVLLLAILVLHMMEAGQFLFHQVLLHLHFNYTTRKQAHKRLIFRFFQMVPLY